MGTCLDGLSGTASIMLSTCYAYISDTVSLERRSYRIMVMEIVSNFLQGGFQLAMGYMITGLGYLWPFVFLLVLHTLNLVYILFFVTESRVPSDDKAGFSPYLIFESFKVNCDSFLYTLFKIPWMKYVTWKGNGIIKYGSVSDETNRLTDKKENPTQPNPGKSLQIKIKIWLFPQGKRNPI